jgi:hypothetical protein
MRPLTFWDLGFAGSELFVVYNEGRDTRASGLPDLQNRSMVVKVNRLLRF